MGIGSILPERESKDCKRTMGRKISWCSGCYDEIELVYNKVIQNPAAASLLSEFEKRALQEAEENCMMINRGNVPITREVFLAMSEADKERVMYILADIGLNEFNPSMSSPAISVTFSQHIHKLLFCTMFSVLNRLEKLDGSYNLILPSPVTLEFIIPTGNIEGLEKCEALLTQLYPWIYVKKTFLAPEAKSNSTSGDLGETKELFPGQLRPKAEPKPQKESFFARLFGQKKKTSVSQTINNIYSSVSAEYRNRIFYGDIKNAGNILQMISKSVFGSLEPDKIELCFQIYFQTWIRCHTSMTPLFLKPEVIKNELYRKFLSVQPEIVNKCVDNSLAIVYSYEPELKQIVDMMNLFESNVAQNAEKNKSIENLYINDPDYGLVPEKPVFVNGFGSDEGYLSHLAAADGSRIEFQRIGSLEIEGIAGPVDIYSLLSPDKKEYMKIYMSVYGTGAYCRIPRGLIYKK